ncbi:hypothetical protein BpHYR1_011013 [Brachionus plicatilis]|uniref:Uncharacterized protein n=1 Tax=Brachionus plicatilis TaxID=10195 RepID=A0A3M7QVQ0_BRAPC|nr:hypothetical protein BpHYR1_011013 [Brachionus plicatilis]
MWLTGAALKLFTDLAFTTVDSKFPFFTDSFSVRIGESLYRSSWLLDNKLKNILDDFGFAKL